MSGEADKTSPAKKESCELRSVIRFLAAKKNSAKDIHTELCQVYGEGCLSSAMVRRWIREFKNGQTDTHNEPRAGWPSVLDEILGYSKVCARWVQKMLTEDHKRQRLKRSRNILIATKLTERNSWIRSLLLLLLSYLIMIGLNKRFLPGNLWLPSFGTKRAYCCATMRQGKTINSDRYCETLKQLRRTIQNKRRGMLTKGVLTFISLPYLKKNLDGTQFQDDNELEEAVLGLLCGQAAEFFDSGFHKWVSRMQKCV
ncbi:hypothetical protein LAZ67_1006966 [Cordylochernes scorpioides]|uniref:Mos1 transposase HTH domain-containing protein n=1 Tax=Cordylochernes scorpioides TaxID=51811 RepID=A0ABY6K1Y7_9ARAC|nr:hypothetical protein LAZ67_1006966 [Cordylochernes scorpioides]